MKPLTNNTGITPMPGYLIVEMFERPKSGLIVRLDNKTEPAPEEQDVYVLEHCAGKDWEFSTELETGTRILALPGQMIPGFLEQRRYVYVIKEEQLLGIYDKGDAANN